jgi:hypothetical protein
MDEQTRLDYRYDRRKDDQLDKKAEMEERCEKNYKVIRKDFVEDLVEHGYSRMTAENCND